MHDMYIEVYFMLFYDLKPDHGDSGDTSRMDNGNIRIELKFYKPLSYSITCLFT